jgi:hypothetical protein
MFEEKNSRRQLLQKVAYAAPIVMTLAVMPAFAKTGSGPANCNNGVGNGPDCDPPGLINKPNLNNDDFGGLPGSPQNQGGTGGVGGNSFTTFSKPKKH